VHRQPEQGVTYARLLTREDYAIDWTLPARALHRRVMGLHPGATTSWRGRRLKLLSTEPLIRDRAGELSTAGAELARRWGSAADRDSAGKVQALAPGVGLVVGSGEGSLLVRSAQLEGRSPSEGQALLQQLGAKEGERFGEG
jgi:methionyl-tRNA formyltransferase